MSMFAVRLLASLGMLFTAVSLAYASTIPDKVACPTMLTIQQSAGKINEATFVNQAYIANTPPYAIHASGFGWFAVVYNINASSSEEAVLIGRNKLKQVSTVQSIYADNLGGMYCCHYDGGQIEVLNNDSNLSYHHG